MNRTYYTPAPDRRAIPEKSGHLYAANDDEGMVQFFDELDRKLVIYGWGFLSGCLFTTGAAYVWGLFL